MARLLLITGDAAARRSIPETLLRAGHSTTVVRSGIEGVEQARRAEWDVVLLGMELPDMNGVGAIDRIREVGCHAPILLLAAELHRMNLDGALDGRRAVGVVAGPVQADALAARVEREIGG